MSISIEEYVLLAQQFYEGRNYSFNVDNLEKILSVSERALLSITPECFPFELISVFNKTLLLECI